MSGPKIPLHSKGALKMSVKQSSAMMNINELRVGYNCNSGHYLSALREISMRTIVTKQYN